MRVCVFETEREREREKNNKKKDCGDMPSRRNDTSILSSEVVVVKTVLTGLGVTENVSWFTQGLEFCEHL